MIRKTPVTLCRAVNQVHQSGSSTSETCVPVGRAERGRENSGADRVGFCSTNQIHIAAHRGRMQVDRIDTNFAVDGR